MARRKQTPNAGNGLSPLPSGPCSPLPGSTVRHAKPPFQGQRGRCSWCGTTELPKGRQTWCSQKCVDEYLSRSRPDHIRRQVYQRDKGICAICGCDAEMEYKAWSAQRKEVARLADKLIHAARWNVDWSGRRMNFRDTSHPPAKESQKFREMMLAKYVPGNWTKGRSTGWDADHIVPVVEGGGECDLSNYRTLCHPCHKGVTAELAARRAEARRIEKRRASGDLFEANASSEPCPPPANQPTTNHE